MTKKLLTLLLLTITVSVFAQYPRASLWTTTINGFAAQDAVAGAPKDVVLFVGSSTFTMWYNTKTDFPNSKVLNRAFGGSMMTDLIYYFNQVVAPYNPRQVVLYEGDNDLHGTTKTPEEFMEDVITMTRLINIYFPNAEILLVSIKPSPSRTVSFAKYQAANVLMKAYADKFTYMDYVDTWTPMLKQDGTPETSYFGSDMLHMNATGYALWKLILEPYLLTGNYEEADKVVFTESSHPYFHDFSWASVTAPSSFTTVQSGKISTDSTYFHSGNTSLKLDYKGVEGGNWMACIAGPTWMAYDISSSKEIQFWVHASTEIAGVDLPNIYLESMTGSSTAKLLLSAYVNQIPAGTWTKVNVPMEDFKTASPSFTYDNVKTIFFSQLNANNSAIKFYIDDIIFKVKSDTPNPNSTADISIDFGSNAGAFVTPGNWNNVHDHQAANLTLIDDNGDNTGISLQVTDPFYNGFNTSGAAAVTGDAAIFAATATSDNFFGHGVAWGTVAANPKGIFKLSGLEPNLYYSLSIFGSRSNVSDNRETKYSVEGKSGVVSTTLNTSNNTTNVAKIINVQANSNAEIIFTCEAGENNSSAEKFYYLGAIKLSKSTQPNSVKTVSDNLQSFYNNGVLKINQYTGPVQVFNMNGKIITSGQSLFGSYAVSLQKGVYILSTLQGNGKLTVM
jgi:lysophospholipase L1-like esterase